MKDRRLVVTIIQPDVVWNNIRVNLDSYSTMLEKIYHETDLVILPEMFATGFTTNPFGLAENMNGETVRWMQNASQKYGCAIAGSTIISDNNRNYNRLIYTDDSGHLASYDKRHLFKMDGEDVHYTPGNKKLIVSLKEWKISFQICYDLRFPVWSKNQNDYDLLVNVANWPEKRNSVWNALLKARAIENQAYVIGVNRVGIDGNGISYKGYSQIISPKGVVLHNLKSKRNAWFTCTLSLNELMLFREKFPVWCDWDRFSIMY